MTRREAAFLLLFGAALLFCLIAVPPGRAQNANQGATATPADAPKQPIAFSHKTHAGVAKIPCKMCHPNPDPGDMMTIVAASTCMSCHSVVKPDSPEIRKLAAFAKNAAPVPWVPVYELPSFVKFSHRVHIAAGTACQDCHGPVAERDRLFREMNFTMAFCVNCHQFKKASMDCAVCHDLPS